MSNQDVDREVLHVKDYLHEPLCFTGKEFRIIRFLLRLLSLWRPQTAGFVERFIYPFLINVVLLVTGPVRNIILASGESTWLSIRFIFLVHELGIWFGHILGNIYFRSRDLEMNVIPEIEPLTGTRRFFKRRLIYLNVGVVISFLLFSIMLPTLFIITPIRLNGGTRRFSSGFPNCRGALDLILYVVDVLSIIPNLGIGLAHSWTIALLFVCFASRLKALKGKYLIWKKTSLDAIYLFQREYSRPLKQSWKQISWWFLAHNFIVVVVPLYGYELARTVGGNDYHSIYLVQYLCYMVFVLTIWLSPIVMAEQFRQREKKFLECVNEFTPDLLEETMEACGQTLAAQSGPSSRPSETTVGASSASGPEEDPQNAIDCESFTFASRKKDLQEFLCYLKNRPQGLVTNWYTLQLNLSLISFFCAVASFLYSLLREYSIGLTAINVNPNSTLT